MNLFNGGYPMGDDTKEPPAYRAMLLKRGKVYETDAGQQITGDGQRYGVFCDDLIVTTPKPDEPNKGMPMPIVYSDGISAAREAELLMERDAQYREDLRLWLIEQLSGLDLSPWAR